MGDILKGQRCFDWSCEVAEYGSGCQVHRAESVIPGTNEGQSQITFMLHIDYVWKEADLSVGVLHHYRHYLMLTENCLIAFITSDSLADAIYQTATKTDFHHLNITYNGLWRL